MTTSHYSGSATIYQFPVGGRAALNSRRTDAKPLAEIASLRAVQAVAVGGWYHEEAIQQAEQTRKN